MFCAHCGNKVISPEARFCPNCGSELYKANKDETENQEKVSTPTNQKSVPMKPIRFGGIIFILFELIHSNYCFNYTFWYIKVVFKFLYLYSIVYFI